MTMRVMQFIAGEWRAGTGKQVLEVRDPSCGEILYCYPVAGLDQIDAAAEAAAVGFARWSKTSAFERAGLMRAAAALIRQNADPIAVRITLEQGKPLTESRSEVQLAADTLEWCADEGRRAYGRVIPSRDPAIRQFVLKEPIGPVAAFSPWNFPLLQAMRKVASALGAGCSIVLKPAEETPGCCAELCSIFQAVGLPDGVLSMLLGMPSQISNRLIAHREIRKISFTGSVSVGKTLAALAGEHLKKSTMELGGHAPFIIFGDVDSQRVANLAAAMKFRNAGQVCASPTRFLVEHSVAENFIATFSEAANALKLGAGLAAETQMGPLANERRVSAVDAMVAGAIEAGGSRVCGGERVGNQGYFYKPTIIMGAPLNCDLNTREPFGPIASVITFRSPEEAWHLANAVPYALSSYVFTNDVGLAHEASANIDAGTVSLNHWGLGAPENPFGGRKDSGYGSEGGTEGLDAYLTTKFVTQLCKPL